MASKLATSRGITDRENDDCISWDGSFNVGSSSSCQILERLRNFHRLRVDEGEEEDIGPLLLILIQVRCPVRVGVEPPALIVREKKVDADDLLDREISVVGNWRL